MLKDFAIKFTSEEIAFKQLGKKFFMEDKNLEKHKLEQREKYFGLYVGEEKEGVFVPSFAFLEWLADRSKEKVFDGKIKVTKKIDKIDGGARSGNKELVKELEVLTKVKAVLDQGKMASTAVIEKELLPYLKAAQLLTSQKMIYALNTDEKSVATMPLAEAKAKAGLLESDTAVLVSAKLEEELIELSPEDSDFC